MGIVSALFEVAAVAIAKPIEITSDVVKTGNSGPGKAPILDAVSETGHALAGAIREGGTRAGEIAGNFSLGGSVDAARSAIAGFGNVLGGFMPTPQTSAGAIVEPALGQDNVQTANLTTRFCVSAGELGCFSPSAGGTAGGQAVGGIGV